MDCKTVTEQLLVDFSSATPNQNEITLHLQACPGCRAEQAAWDQLVYRLQQVEVPDPGEAFWRNFTLSVKQAIAPQRETQKIWEGFSFPPLFPTSRWAMAAVAAMVIIVTGIFRFTGWRAAPPASALSLEAVVHLADWSDSDASGVLFDLMEDDAEEMDFMIGSDRDVNLSKTNRENIKEI